jgi:hypothetical protein
VATLHAQIETEEPRRDRGCRREREGESQRRRCQSRNTPSPAGYLLCGQSRVLRELAMSGPVSEAPSHFLGLWSPQLTIFLTSSRKRYWALLSGLLFLEDRIYQGCAWEDISCPGKLPGSFLGGS